MFKRFDINGGGSIGKEELLLLGEARRKLGHKKGKWGKEQNDIMFSRMDTNGDGELDREEFVTFFMSPLREKDRENFDEEVLKFLEVAEEVIPL